MDRATYTECMTPHMTGTGKTKEQRQHDMCVGAKVCSGKAQTEKEAEQICLSQPPKEPKPRKSRGGKCPDPIKLAECVSTNLDIEGLTVDNLRARLETSIQHCSLAKGAKPPTYKRFMASCLKETGGAGDFRTSQRDIKACQSEWDKTRGT